MNSKQRRTSARAGFDPQSTKRYYLQGLRAEKAQNEKEVEMAQEFAREWAAVCEEETLSLYQERYMCRDRMCGAGDCDRCWPSTYRKLSKAPRARGAVAWAEIPAMDPNDDLPF